MKETHGKVTVQKRGEEECRQGGVGGYVSGGMDDRSIAKVKGKIDSEAVRPAVMLGLLFSALVHSRSVILVSLFLICIILYLV